MAKKIKKNKKVQTGKSLSLSQTVQNNFSSFILGVFIVFVLIGAGAKYLFLNNPSVLSADIKKLFVSPKTAKGSTSVTPEDLYVVQPGDDLCLIAQKLYGDCNLGYKIAELNHLKSPDQIEIGQKLIFKAHATPTPSAVANQVKKSDTTYVVKDGDSFTKIAKEEYGDESMASRIAEANNLTDSDVLFTGSKLTIPR